MKKEMLEAINNENMKEVCKHMILPQQHYGVVMGRTEYNFSDLDNYCEAIDYENRLIKIDVWMKNMLEFDDYSKHINKLLFEECEKDNDMFDYAFFDYLKDVLGEEITLETQGYTYKDSDYCRLDRDIHYTVFEHDSDYYIIFSVHHGADARIGFSYNACFKLNESDYLHLSMTIDVYDSITDSEYQAWEVEDIATYNKEQCTWFLNENNHELSLYSCADGH